MEDKTATIERCHRSSYSVVDKSGKAIGSLDRFKGRQEWVVNINDIRKKSHHSDIERAIALAKEILIEQGYEIRE